MQLKDFGYKVPDKLIAQHPLKDRTKARLMVINRKEQTIAHDVFDNIGQYLPPESVLVLNNSKVIPARLLGQKERTGGSVEIFILKPIEGTSTFEVLLRPLKKIRNNDKIIFNGSRISATVLDREKRIVQFNTKDVYRHLDRIGHMPLPPYIKRDDTKNDKSEYQTVYAEHQGSVAAPTAGLHFDKPLLNRLQKNGHDLLKVTLHINYATFKPVEEADITQHDMHKEEYLMSKEINAKIHAAKKTGRKIVAVGTTACRVLESVAATKKLKGDTDLFIYPGYAFKTVDCLITNFHLPFSTLLMLVYAFGSEKLMKRAYREAVKNEYRFYSYGDAMLIL